MMIKMAIKMAIKLMLKLLQVALSKDKIIGLVE
jgi:hypothetical protein